MEGELETGGSDVGGDVNDSCSDFLFGNGESVLVEVEDGRQPVCLDALVVLGKKSCLSLFRLREEIVSVIEKLLWNGTALDDGASLNGQPVTFYSTALKRAMKE